MKAAGSQENRIRINGVLKCLRTSAGRLDRLPLCDVDRLRRANDSTALFMLAHGALMFRQLGNSTILQPHRLYVLPPRSGYQLQAQHVPAELFTLMPHGGRLVVNGLRTQGHELLRSRGSTLVSDPGTVAPLLAAVTAWADPDTSAWNHLVRALLHAVRTALAGDAQFVDGGVHLLARAQGLMEQHFTEASCGVKFLAEQLACHPDYLARIYRRREGRSIREALLELRLRRARSLMLTERETQLADIARRCGFRNGPRLSEHFQKVFGLTPSELRRQAHTYATGGS